MAGNDSGLEVRTYVLRTGNTKFAEALNAGRLGGEGWDITGHAVERELIDNAHVRVINPEGEVLEELKITTSWRQEIMAVIEQDLEDRGETNIGPAAPTVIYQGTTGNAQAAKAIGTPMGDGWVLRVSHHREWATDHMQLLAPDGKAMAYVKPEPVATLVERVTEVIEAHRAHASQPPSAPLICVRQMPTGSVLMTLWLSGQEFVSARPGSGADESRVIFRGPEAFADLSNTMATWKREHPGAIVDSEVPLADLAVSEEQAAAGADATTAPLVETEADVLYRLREEKRLLEPVVKSGRSGFDGKKLSAGEIEERRSRLAWVNIKLAQMAAADGKAQETPQPASVIQPLVVNGPEWETAQVERPSSEQIVDISIDAIVHFPGGNQREDFKRLDELAASIKEHGILQPLIVNERAGRYILVAGERRLRAAGMAGLTHVRCSVVQMTEEQALEAMLIENIQREDLNPIEEARAYKRLMAFPGASQGSIGRRVGKPREHVNETLQLLDLPSEIAQRVSNGEMARRTALEYLRQTRNQPEPVRQAVAKTLAEEKPPARDASKVIERALQEEGVVRTTPQPAVGKTSDEQHLPSTETAQSSTDPGESSTPPAAPPLQVDPHAERAQRLADIGRQLWDSTRNYSTVLFGRECYLPLERVFKHWDLRQDIGANSLPASFGHMKVTIPEQRIYIHADEPHVEYVSPVTKAEVTGRHGQTAIQVHGAEITVQCGSGYGGGGTVEGVYTGNPVYFRVELWKASSGGQKTIEQQLVIQDGGRHIVITGSGTAMIRQELVPNLAELVTELPGLPEW